MAKWPVEVDKARSYFPPGWRIGLGQEFIATGGGVQSAGLSLLARRGDIRAPAAWVACDTWHETPATHATWMHQRKIAMELGAAFVMLQRPISIVEKFTAERRLPLPHRRRPSCSTWAKRDAMREWIRRRFREDLGLTRYGPAQAVCVMGISTDEAAERANDSDRKWIVNRYPLVDLGWSRRKIIQLLKDEWDGPVQPEKSGCNWCPWLGPKGLAALAVSHPADFAAVEAMEKAAQPGSGTLFKGMTLQMLRENAERGGVPIRERDRPVPGEGQDTLQAAIEREQGSCARSGACFT